MERSAAPERICASRAWLQRLAQPVRAVAIAWSLLLTVLACAVAPQGLPETSLHGSAFNPATIGVALDARVPRERLIAQRRLDPGPAEPGSGPFAAAPLPVAIASAARVQSPRRFRKARGPPAAA